MSMSGINTNQPPTVFQQEVMYKECLHNHAAALGRVSYDGCPEYLKGHADLNNQDALLCACCGCHRNFHRKDIHIVFNVVPETQSENGLNTGSLAGPFQLEPTNNLKGQEMKPKRKKRTTFSPEQRNRLMRFANSVGWKPQKEKEDEIQSFCSEMGIAREVFAVWLNNNRHRAI